MEQLRDMAEGKTPIDVMSLRLDRSEDAIKAKAEDIPLAPADRRRTAR